VWRGHFSNFSCTENSREFPTTNIGESPLNRNDPKSEQYSLDLLKRVIPNFQIVWRHRSELGFVPVKGTLPYTILCGITNMMAERRVRWMEIVIFARFLNVKRCYFINDRFTCEVEL
jgi:hypothetical protein